LQRFFQNQRARFARCLSVRGANEEVNPPLVSIRLSNPKKFSCPAGGGSSQVNCDKKESLFQFFPYGFYPARIS